MKRGLRWWLSVVVLLGGLGIGKLHSMEAAPDVPQEMLIYTEDFWSYTNKAYVDDIEWDIEDQKLMLSLEDGISQASPDVLADGEGGIWITWEDSRLGSKHIYLQRIDAYGNRLWVEDVKVNKNEIETNRYAPTLVPDNSGGVFVVWSDYRNATYDFYAQRIDALGNHLWAQDQRVNANTEETGRWNFDAIPDSYGGVSVVWEDSWDENIYTQRINQNGDRYWAQDKQVNTSVFEYDGYSADPVAVSGTSGSFLVVWGNRQGDSGSIFNLYAQRVDINGNRLWGSDQRVNQTPDTVSWLAGWVATQDGNGGAVVAWGNTVDSKSYAQRLDPNGAPQWAQDIAISDGFRVEALDKTSAGDFVMVWSWGSMEEGLDIYAQRFTVDGSPSWPFSGKRVNISSWGSCWGPTVTMAASDGAFVAWISDGEVWVQRLDASGAQLWLRDARANERFGRVAQRKPATIPDGEGGIFVTWQDYRHYDRALYIQKIDASGNLIWMQEQKVSQYAGTVESWQYDPVLALDGEGGCYIVWRDSRYAAYWLNYVQHIDAQGNHLWMEDLLIGYGDTPTIVSDNAGGFIVVWESDDEILAQRYDAEGNPLWPDSKRIHVDTSDVTRTEPAIIRLSSGYYLVAWWDQRGSQWNVYAQSIDVNGIRLWASDKRVNLDANMQWDYQYGVGLAPDNDGGAYVMWADDSVGNWMRVQRLSGAGVRQWSEDILLPGWSFAIAQDGTGGAYLAWVNGYNIGMQRVNSAGTKLWGDDVYLVFGYEYAYSTNPSLSLVATGGVYGAWNDSRRGVDEVYIHRLYPNGAAVWTSPMRVTPENYYYAPSGTAQSKSIDMTEDQIAHATLTAQYILQGGELTFYLTNDGTTWSQVSPGVKHVFTTTGSDLRWLVYIQGDPLWQRTPIVDGVRIEYATIPPGGDAYEPDDACSQAQSIQVNGDAQAHNFYQYEDEDWAWFDVISGTTYIVQTSNTQANADTELELRAACPQPPFAGDDNVFGQDARITWRATFSGPVYVKVAHHDPAVYGADTGYDLAVRTFTQPPVAVIVAGHDDRYSLQSNIDAMADMAYRTFLNSGVPKTNIRYFGPNPARDVDGNGLNDDLYATVTITGVRDAVQNWSREQGVQLGVPFYVYLVDHGYYDQLLAAGSSTKVWAADLNLWLSNLEATSGADNINVILEACKSGSFIDMTELGPAQISGHNRVVIASTSSTLNAYPSPQGGYFSDVFWTALGQNQDLKTAFEWAKQAVQATELSQQPWLDDNGDAVADAQDGALARGRGLGGAFAGSPPVIDWATVEETSGQATLQAQVRDDFDVGLVWAEVYAPDFVEPEPSQDGTTPVVNIPTTTLTLTGSDLYGATYPLTQTGSYRLVVYALDDEGNRALPQVTRLCAGCTFVYLPLVLRGK